MQCPACTSTLRLAERHSVEIDYCPQCRGVWLERGELDKIIERATPASSRWWREEDAAFDSERHDRDYSERKGRRRSFLSELFDFD